MIGLGGRYCVVRLLLVAVAGACAWMAGMTIVFGPAQRILADPQRQSAKFYAAFADPSAPPHSDAHGWILPAGVFVVAIAFACAYAIVEKALGSSRLQKGARFGLVAWLLMAVWFEFYLPWNVMLEPWPLVLLELLCWFLVLQIVGQAIAWTYAIRRRDREPGAAMKQAAVLLVTATLASGVIGCRGSSTPGGAGSAGAGATGTEKGVAKTDNAATRTTPAGGAKQITPDAPQPLRPKPPAVLPTGKPLGRWVGVLPCADCEARRTDLTLYTDPEEYVSLDLYYSTPDGDKTFTSQGVWKIIRGIPSNPKAMVYQIDPDNPAETRSFLVVDDTRLRLLDRDLKPISSNVNLTLIRQEIKTTGAK